MATIDDLLNQIQGAISKAQTDQETFNKQWQEYMDRLNQLYSSDATLPLWNSYLARKKALEEESIGKIRGIMQEYGLPGSGQESVDIQKYLAESDRAAQEYKANLEANQINAQREGLENLMNAYLQKYNISQGFTNQILNYYKDIVGIQRQDFNDFMTFYNDALKDHSPAGAVEIAKDTFRKVKGYDYGGSLPAETDTSSSYSYPVDAPIPAEAISTSGVIIGNYNLQNFKDEEIANSLLKAKGYSDTDLRYWDLPTKLGKIALSYGIEPAYLDSAEELRALVSGKVVVGHGINKEDAVAIATMADSAAKYLQSASTKETYAQAVADLEALKKAKIQYTSGGLFPHWDELNAWGYVRHGYPPPKLRDMHLEYVKVWAPSGYKTMSWQEYINAVTRAESYIRTHDALDNNVNSTFSELQRIAAGGWVDRSTWNTIKNMDFSYSNLGAYQRL